MGNWNWKNWHLLPRPDLVRLVKDGIWPSSASLKMALEERGEVWRGRRAALKRLDVAARALELDEAWVTISLDPVPGPEV